MAVVAASFNRPMTQALVAAATRTLQAAGLPSGSLRVLWVPGAFELPAAAARVARRRPTPQAIIALGVLIRGQTSQYQAIAHAVTEGLTRVSVEAALPVTLGVVVAESVAQAKARTGRGPGNRGREAALAAITMIDVFDRLRDRLR